MSSLLYYFLLFASSLLLQYFPGTANSGELIDLTYPFNSQTIYWPTAKGFELNKIFWGVTQKGYLRSHRSKLKV